MGREERRGEGRGERRREIGITCIFMSKDSHTLKLVFVTTVKTVKE